MLVAQMPLAEVPAENGARHVLPVDVAVLLQRATAERRRQEEAQAASLEMQGAEGHAPRVHVSRLFGRETPELILQEGRGPLQPVELLVAVAAEGPGVPGPVPRV